jgi:hypothetical protein
MYASVTAHRFNGAVCSTMNNSLDVLAPQSPKICTLLFGSGYLRIALAT